MKTLHQITKKAESSFEILWGQYKEAFDIKGNVVVTDTKTVTKRAFRSFLTQAIEEAVREAVAEEARDAIAELLASRRDK